MNERRAGHLILVVYLAVAIAFFASVALPALRGEIDFQFYADSLTYEELAEESQGLSDLVQVAFNALGPYLILRALGSNRILVFGFNVGLFLAAYHLLRSSHAVDARRLTAALVLSPVLFSSLMSVNKEILALLVAALVAAYYARGATTHLVLALVVSPLVRWQLTVFVVAAAVLQAGPLRRHRGLALVGLLGACSLAYPLLLGAGRFESVDDVAQLGALQAAEGSGLYNFWLSVQNQYGYFLIVLPKTLHLFVGLVSRLDRVADLSDVYNNAVATSQALANLGILTLVLLLRKFRLSEGPAFLACAFGVIFGLSPIYSPRYLFPIYVFLAVLFALRSVPSPTLSLASEAGTGHRAPHEASNA